MKKIYIILLFAWVFVLYSKSQTCTTKSDKIITEQTPYSVPCLNLTARDKIYLKSGFSYSGTSGSFVGKIDESMIINNDFLLPSEVVNPATRIVTDNPTVTGVTGVASITDKGAASYSIPIEVVPGTNGLEPSLSIMYNSQGELSNLGVGWYVNCENLISRTNQGGPITLTASDNYALNGNKLVNLEDNAGTDHTYTTEVPTFSKIIAIGSNNGTSHPTSFKVLNSDGSIMQYGLTDNAKLLGKDNLNASIPLIWALSKVTDAHGNTMEYEYYNESTAGRLFIKKIKYCKSSITNQYINEVNFYYSDFTTSIEFYIGKNTVKQNTLIRKITVTSNGALENEYSFDYISSTHPRLSAVNRMIKGKKINSCLIQWGNETSNSLSSLIDLGDAFLTSTYDRLDQKWIRDFNGDGKEDLVIRHDKTKYIVYLSTTTGFSKCVEITSSYANITVGYFNKDNLADIVSYSRDSNGKLVTQLYTGNAASGLLLEANSNIPLTECWAPVASPYYSYSGDLNGDNYDDIIICSSVQKSVYVFINSQGWYYTSLFSGTGTYTSAPFCAAEDIIGDQKDELVYLNSTDNAVVINKWALDHFTSQSINIDVYGSSTFGDPLIIDYNRDGYKDIAVRCDDGKTKVIYSQGNEVSTQIKNINDAKVNDLFDKNGDKLPESYFESENPLNSYSYGFVHGDFDGNGTSDVLYLYELTNSHAGVQMNYYNNSIGLYLTKTITDGFNNAFEFTYSPVVQVAGYYRTSNMPSFVGDCYSANTLKTTKKGDVIRIIQNLYEQPYCDSWGDNQKGFLGFKKVTTSESASGSVIKRTIKEYNQTTTWGTPVKTYIAPSLWKVSVFDGSNSAISTVENTWDVATTFAPDDKSVNLYLKSSVATDIYGIVTNTEYGTPNDYGQVLVEGNNTFSKRITWGTTNLIKETITDTYNSNSVTSGNWNIGTLSSSTTVKTHYNDPGKSYTLIKAFDYFTGTRDLQKVTLNPATDNYVTDQYEYYTNGTLKKHTQGTRYTSYTYDECGRFQTDVIDVNGDKITSTYNCWGKVLSAKSSITGLTTTNIYDDFGRLVRTDNPEGTYTEYSINWATSSNDANSLLVTSSISSDGTQSFSEANGAGQILHSKTTDYNGNWIVVDKTYYPAGMLKTETLPYKSGSTSSTMTYTYNKERIETKVGPGINISYSYASKSTIGYDVTVTDKGITPNSTSTTTYNAVGKVTNVLERNSNNVVYKYNAMGQPAFVDPTGNAVGSANAVYFHYDFLGRRIGIKEPSMGTFVDATTGLTLSIKYGYNQWDELVYKKDAKGNEYTNVVYNDLGQLTTETQSGVTTNYHYFTSGTNKNQLEYIERSGIRYTYSYNSYGDIAKKTETIDGVNYVFNYTYDNQGRMETMEYPTGLKLKYTYANGFMKSISDFKNPGTEYWRSDAMDDKGHYTQITTGNQYKIQYGYTSDSYILDYIKATNNSGTVIQNLDYNFNPYTNNLTFRADLLKGDLKEEFGYDALDRLTTSAITKTGNAAINSATTYTSSGNPAVVDTKTGLGKFTYYSDKSYQVYQVENTSNIITTEHEITYTGFNKVATISDVTNNLLLTMTYGPDNAKKVSILKENGSDIRKRIYLDNYEVETDYVNNQTRQLCYINSPSGIVGIVEKVGEAETMYYVFTDHLGSWNVIADASGNKITAQEMSFDAWGNRRNASTWANNGSLTYKFYRGFTGHEHWDELGLIDMNGRVYDPVLGMFISLDPYVQDPSNSQNFNRYAYCLNNPLKYTDPTGEFAWLPVILGAVFGGLSGYQIGKAHGATGLDMIGYIAGGTLIGGLSGGIASTISVAGGSTMISASVASAVGGAGFNGLASGWKGNAMTTGFVNGFISGLVGGGFGGAIGGGWGALVGGASANITNQLLYNDGDFGNINWKSVGTSGITSLGLYHAISYAKWQWGGGKNFGDVKLKYSAFNKLNAMFTRARFWRREHGAWILENGSFEKFKGVINTKTQILNLKNLEVPTGAKYLVHTHYFADGWAVGLGTEAYADSYHPSYPGDYEVLDYFQKNGMILTNRSLIQYYPGTEKYDTNWSYPLLRYIPLHFW